MGTWAQFSIRMHCDPHKEGCPPDSPKLHDELEAAWQNMDVFQVGSPLEEEVLTFRTAMLSASGGPYLGPDIYGCSTLVTRWNPDANLEGSLKLYTWFWLEIQEEPTTPWLEGLARDLRARCTIRSRVHAFEVIPTNHQGSRYRKLVLHGLQGWSKP